MDIVSMIAATVAVAMLAITVSLFSADLPTGLAGNATSTGAQHATPARH